MPELAQLASQIGAKQAIVDAELVAFDAAGRPSFGALQRRFGFPGYGGHRESPNDDAPKAASIALFCFDLLYVEGYDLREVPLLERKRLLQAVLRPGALARYSEHFTGNGRELLEAARLNGLEGIMAKRATSRYEDRRSDCWLKIKFVREQEFVVVGWMAGERSGFGSLVLAFYEGKKLVYAGCVGSGFTDRGSASLRAELAARAATKAPFSPVPEEVRDAHWVRPELVAAVKFSSWTDDERLRAPVFIGLRDDVDPKECVREREIQTAEDAKGAKKGKARRVRVDAGDSPAPLSRAAPGRAGGVARVHTSQSTAPLIPAGANELTLEVSEGEGSFAALRISAAGSRSAAPSLTPARRLKFTNLNKVFYPREGYTKRDVINFYAAVHPLLLPHLQDRPLSLRRYPNGIAGEAFFQKNTPETYPAWLRTEPVETEPGKTTRFLFAADEASLLYLANLGCIDQNPWMSRMGSLANPDWVLIDLDPVDCGYDRIVEAALLVRDKLDALGLRGYPKTTGGDGMHVYVPVEPHYTYEQTRTFAEILARLVAHERPDLFTTPRTVAQREKGKVYFDYLQNMEGKTISAPYVLRAYPGAPVATPLDWSEVTRSLKPEQFHIANAMERFGRVGDLFAPVLAKPQRLEPALKKLEALVRGAAKR